MRVEKVEEKYNSEEKKKGEEDEELTQKERERLENIVLSSYHKTKAILEESDAYLIKCGFGNFVKENNKLLEDSIDRFRK